MSQDENGHLAPRRQRAANAGQATADELLARVYDQLRKLARKQMKDENAGHTLQPTALVHEAYLRLVGPREVPWSGRGHFYAAAAEAMRRILVDRARAKSADKRGGDARRWAVELASLPDLASAAECSGFLILDEALSRLEKVVARACEVVRLRYFAGLSVEDTAAALGVSAPTVKRTWAFARAWLKEAIEREV